MAAIYTFQRRLSTLLWRWNCNAFFFLSRQVFHSQNKKINNTDGKVEDWWNEMEMERDLSRNIFPLGWIEWFEFEPVKLAHAFNLLLFSRCFFLLFLVVVSFWIEMNWRVPAIWINRKSNGRLNASKITITIMKVSPSFVNGGACSADTVDTTAAAAPFFFFIYIKFFFLNFLSKVL